MHARTIQAVLCVMHNIAKMIMYVYMGGLRWSWVQVVRVMYDDDDDEGSRKCEHKHGQQISHPSIRAG